MSKGSQAECLDREKLLNESLKNDNLKTKVNKQPAPKAIASNNQEIQAILNREYSEARIKQLEDKLKERDEAIVLQDLAYEKLQKEFDSYKTNSNLKTDGNHFILNSKLL